MQMGSAMVCRSCGARYDVNRFACTRCDVGLVPEERVLRIVSFDGDGPSVPVAALTFKQRTELVDLLEREDVAHRWEGSGLVVAEGDVELVRALIAQVEGAMPAYADDDAEEVGYELDDWLPDQQAELVAALAAEGIPNRWEGTEVVVPEQHADRVEEMIDEIDHPDALAAEEAVEDDAGGELLGVLFVAADVLQHDPSDPVAVRDLLDAAERADVDGVPYGVDVAVWDGVRRMAGDVADLLGEQADEERVATAARALRDALRDMV
jgi:hypothetical protein